MKYIFSLVMAGISITSLNAQLIDIGKIPAAVMSAFKVQHPRATNMNWSGKVVHYTVNFNDGGENLTAHYKKDGAWEETYMGLPFKNLPSSIKNGFQNSKFSGWQVKEVRRIDSKDRDRVYRIQVKKNPVQKKHLFFDLNGRLLEDNITL
ncbi:MAG: ribosome biosis protein [Chitinophagaceae bacterium]|nr:ribosome biosis protein [Chitinophagaceae bacterium]